MDPEVEIRVIDLADDWSSVKEPDRDLSAEAIIKERAKRFDQAFKAIIKTLGYEIEAATED